MSRSENPLSAHPTPRGSSQRNSWYRGQPYGAELVSSSVPLPRDEEYANMLSPSYAEADRILMDDIWWYDGTPGSVRGGVNLTRDFENALGYAGSEGVVFELDEIGHVAELDFGYGLAKSVDDVRVARIYSGGSWAELATNRSENPLSVPSARTAALHAPGQPRKPNPLSAHPTPRGSSQRNQMHPHATRMLADYWRAFTPDDVHPWLDDMYAGVHVTPWAFAALAYALQKRELWEDDYGRMEVTNPGVLLGISKDVEAGPYDADALTFARALVQKFFPLLLAEEDLWDEDDKFDAEALWSSSELVEGGLDGFAQEYVSEGEYFGIQSTAGDVANRPLLTEFVAELETGNDGEGWTREQLEEEPEDAALRIAAGVVPQGRVLGEVPAEHIVAVVVVENYPPGQDGDFAEEFEAAGKEFPYWAADYAEVDLENFSDKVLEEGTLVWGDLDDVEFWHGTSLDNAKAALPEILTPDVIERAEVAGRLWPDPPDPYDEEDDE